MEDRWGRRHKPIDLSGEGGMNQRQIASWGFGDLAIKLNFTIIAMILTFFMFFVLRHGTLTA